MDGWTVPSFYTEGMSCDAWNAAQGAGISTSYWHYSSYCNIGSDSSVWWGNKTVDDSDAFGACILGWDSGDSSKCAEPGRRAVRVPTLVEGVA